MFCHLSFCLIGTKSSPQMAAVDLLTEVWVIHCPINEMIPILLRLYKLRSSQFLPDLQFLTLNFFFNIFFTQIAFFTTQNCLLICDSFWMRKMLLIIMTYCTRQILLALLQFRTCLPTITIANFYAPLQLVHFYALLQWKCIVTVVV